MENDVGERTDVTVNDLAEAVDHRWPPLLFLSGCHTGQASDSGDLASMAESLVAMGAPLVLGWALPVGDIAASRTRRGAYGSLVAGEGCEWAVTKARRALFAGHSPFWHLLRRLHDRSSLGRLVTVPANALGGHRCGTAS